MTDSTESNSANHKISRSIEQSKEFLDVSDDNRGASQEKPREFQRVINTINQGAADLSADEPLSPTTPTSATEIAKMRIKRKLNFNRKGTTEQPQMRSSKYQSMKEVSKHLPNKNGPKKVTKLSEHIESGQFG